MALLEDVYLPTANYSNFDRSTIWRSTMRPGVLYPCLFERVLPGTMVKMSARSILQTIQLQAPLMGSFKLQVDTFWVPLRLYNLDMRLNSNNFDRDTPLPIFNLPTSFYKSDVKVKGYSNNNLLSFLGVPPYYFNLSFDDDHINGVGILAYYDIFRHYYVNKQADDFYYYKNGSLLLSESSKIDDAFDWYLKSIPGSVSVNDFLNHALDDYNYNNNGENYYSYGYAWTNDAEGLLLRNYFSDMNTSWLSSQTYNQINTQTKVVSTVDGDSASFTMNQLLIADKLFDSYNIEMVSGSQYSDFMKGQYAVNMDTASSQPTLIMSNSSELWFETVVSTSSTVYNGENQPLGELAGRGQGRMNGDSVSIVADEPGYIMSIVSIIPRVDYYQGVKPCLNDLLFSDLMVPAFDNLGFQSLPVSQLSGYPTDIVFIDSDSASFGDGSGYPVENSLPLYFGVNVDPTKEYEMCLDSGEYYPPILINNSNAVGYQPAWTDYMTNVNSVHGDFVDSLRYWTLSRNYYNYAQDFDSTLDVIPTFFDPTTYVDPDQWNFAFSDIDGQADNFQVQISFNLLFNEPISKRVMPQL